MWKFSKQDVTRLRAALKRAKDARWYKRIEAVLLVATGIKPPQAALLTGQCRSSVYNLLNRYAAHHRPEDLADEPRSGRPKAAAVLTPSRINRELKRDPLALGYMATEWTVALLAEHLHRRYHCPINRRTLRRRLKCMDLVWKRPRHVYAKAPHRSQKKGLWSGGLYA